MNSQIERRVIDEALCVVSEKSTVRAVAKKFGVGKSTTHKDLTTRLKQLDYNLYLKAREVLDLNLSERHIRGGNATKRKYESLK